MELSVVSKSYRLEVPLEDFEIIMEDEGFIGNNSYLFWNQIQEISEIYDIEYHRHYGPAIFYSVYEEDNTEELHKKIQQLFVDTVKQLKDEK